MDGCHALNLKKRKCETSETDKKKEWIQCETQSSSDPNTVKEPLSNHGDLDQLLHVSPKKGKTRRKEHPM